ncbi:hypothetical protein NMS_1360 [Nonlabens marinus S1-08]|uniref:Uncharacterized protein n=1 Tax=Nonlabens marinus S1-08 TaxID=1454201 RepID=W8VQ00_9FLAO|nr:hypothetical protein NMS_1360 [Nonlabens marinus S1-08]
MLGFDSLFIAFAKAKSRINLTFLNNSLRYYCALDDIFKAI